MHCRMRSRDAKRAWVRVAATVGQGQLQAVPLDDGLSWQQNTRRGAPTVLARLPRWNSATAAA
jgi:hypothetical protein